MSVHVDPAGRDEQAVRVELAAAAFIDAPDRDDAAALHADVAAEARASGAIEDRSAADHEVEHRVPSGVVRRSMLLASPEREPRRAAPCRITRITTASGSRRW